MTVSTTSPYRGLSLWHDQVAEAGDDLTPRPALDGDLDCDVVVVGAGFTGLWTASSSTARSCGSSSSRRRSRASGPAAATAACARRCSRPPRPRWRPDTAAPTVEPGRVRTDRGTVTAGNVVRATEAWTSTIDGSRRDVIPVYSLVMATEPLPADVWHTIGLARRETFSEHRHLVVYGRTPGADRWAYPGTGTPA